MEPPLKGKLQKSLSRRESVHMQSVLGISDEVEPEFGDCNDGSDTEESSLPEPSPDTPALEMAKQWQSVLNATEFPVETLGEFFKSNGSDDGRNNKRHGNNHRRSSSEVYVSNDEFLSSGARGIKKSASVSYSSSSKLSSSPATLESLFASPQKELSSRPRSKPPSPKQKQSISPKADKDLFPTFSISKGSPKLGSFSRLKSSLGPTPTFKLQDQKSHQTLSNSSAREKPPLPRESPGNLRTKFSSLRLQVPQVSSHSPEVSPEAQDKSPSKQKTNPSNPTKLNSISRFRDWHKLSMDHRHAEDILKKVVFPSSSPKSRKASLSDVGVVLGDIPLEEPSPKPRQRSLSNDDSIRKTIPAEEEPFFSMEGAEPGPAPAPAPPSHPKSSRLTSVDPDSYITDVSEVSVSAPMALSDCVSDLSGTMTLVDQVLTSADLSGGEEASRKLHSSTLAAWQDLKKQQLNEAKDAHPNESSGVPVVKSSSVSCVSQPPRAHLTKAESMPVKMKALNSAPRDPALEPADPEVREAMAFAEVGSNFGPLLALARHPDSSVERVRAIMAGIRALTKPREASASRVKMVENRGVDFLLTLLDCSDAETVEHAVSVLMNLSLEEYIKDEIFSARTVASLAQILKGRNEVARQNAAATLYLLTNTDERQVAVGQARGAIPALLDLLLTGSLRGKKDAALALFNLSLNGANRQLIIKSDGVRKFLDILKEGKQAALEEKVISLLEKLCKEKEGRMQVVLDVDGISTLVDMLQSSSEYCKTEAVSTLLYLAKVDPTFESLIDQEGPRPTLHKLCMSNSERLKKKAQLLYERLKRRNQTATIEESPRSEHD